MQKLLSQKGPCVYVLLLECNKYYVGKTNDLKKRLQEHHERRGCKWTTKYRVVRLVGTVANANPFDELKYTLMYMDMFGIENVRGSIYCKYNLTEQETNEIQRHIRASKDQCYECGSDTHFIANCPGIVKRDELLDPNVVCSVFKILSLERETIVKVKVISRSGCVSYDMRDETTDVVKKYIYGDIIEISSVTDEVWLECKTGGHIKIFKDDNSVVVELIKDSCSESVSSLCPYI